MNGETKLFKVDVEMLAKPRAMECHLVRAESTCAAISWVLTKLTTSAQHFEALTVRARLASED